MDIRKVQFTGGSSYIVTLPKEWIESQNIKKNDPLGLKVLADGSLSISKDIKGETRVRRARIKATKITDMIYLFRLLVGAYISGFTEIEIESENKISPSIRQTIKSFVQISIGPEIIEESDSTILLKDLLNPLEMPFANTIKRMYVITKLMFSDVFSFLVSNDTDLALDIINRDTEVDRLQWLVARQANMVFQDTTLAGKIGSDYQMVAHIYNVSRIIERIADHAVKITENFMKIVKVHPLDESHIKELVNANDIAMKIFDSAMAAFFNNDLKGSHTTIESVKKLEEICKTLRSHAAEQETDIAIAIRYSIESIKRAGEYSADIAESVINSVIGNEN